MEIRELTEQMHRFVQSKGWYADTSTRPQTLKNLAISLTLEACEVLEQFQWQEQPLDHTLLAEELADVFLYLLQIASLAEIDLEKVTLEKLEKNYQRKWK
ncbi:MAG: nucleotide pyrophosphohydrolase [Anaerolineae bacterium]|jgi:NTP pyrophosphatase (non-canonical NTP hydrolase)|nr:MAG: nucleotide pyrophosphohydrolase [Anaerolineae bacterium]